MFVSDRYAVCAGAGCQASTMYSNDCVSLTDCLYVSICVFVYALR